VPGGGDQMSVISRPLEAPPRIPPSESL
jgi:hypothetical protein